MVHKYKFFMFIFVIILIFPIKTFGAWPEDPTTGVPICTADGIQEHPRITTDGAGGAIIVWQDMSSSSSDIYAQRIDARGQVRWTKDGVAVCIEKGNQWHPNIVSDGEGGAIIAWWDGKISYTETDIYAQRINADGKILWKAGGIPICKASGAQQEHDMIADGAGGAIIVWHDYRNANIARDVYAQRVNAKGKTLWTNDGVAVSKVKNDQVYPNLVSDGAGGAIIAWHDGRDDSGDVYAQHLDAKGNALWEKDGIPICKMFGSQLYPAIAQDGFGGAIITWMDDRNGGNWDVYAQRVDAKGKILWLDDCVPVCTANLDQYDYSVFGDNKGGAFIAWRDMRDENWRIYAQRIDAEGNPAWKKDGILVSIEKGSQYNPNMVSDGADGVIITWWDARDVVADIYAQRIDSKGNFLWVKGGAGICIAEGGQQDPYPVNSGIGSAIIVWWDKRRIDADIYAQRIFSE
ncbi:TPA: hypothetical protein ENS27_09540 [bacterium]|nr:hypothetical protein [bacterium]